MNRLRKLCVTMLAAAALGGCARKEHWDPRKDIWDVEISPGNYLTVARSWNYRDPDRPKTLLDHLAPPGNVRKEKAKLEMVYQGRPVTWQDHSRPKLLRERDGRLYVISFDRVTRGIWKCFFRYYVQQGDSFVEITPKEFPKDIAGENMDLGLRFFPREHGDPYDMVKTTRDQDPADPQFPNSLTAYIWNELSTGEPYFESFARYNIDRQVLENYIAAHKPVKLTFERMMSATEHLRPKTAEPTP